MMTDKERIEYVINKSEMTYAEFSARTGISPATLSHIVSGRSKPTLAIMRGILAGFPDINPQWMFMGEGEFCQQDKPSTATTDSGHTVSGALDLFGQLGAEQKSENGSSLSSRLRAADPPAQIDIPSIVKQTVESMQRPERKITEVRIFFDDGTYEAFKK